ncbi:MAG: hypothetical protein AB8B56_18980 [Crocinitomicaceae bacterium]
MVNYPEVVNTSNYILQLSSNNRAEVLEAIEYFEELFYFDLAISDEEYVNVTKVLVDKLTDPNDSIDKQDIFCVIESSLYTNDPSGTVSPEAFCEALSYIANSRNPIFREILKPHLSMEKIKPIISDYFDSIQS